MLRLVTGNLKGGFVADEEKPGNSGGERPKDQLKEFGNRIRAGLAVGKLVFDNVVVPKAKEVLETAKGVAEGKLNQVRDSFDPTRGLAKNAVEARNWLMNKGFGLKRANEVIVETVARAVKAAKPEEKKDG